NVIDKEVYPLGRPLDGKDVEVVGKALSIRESIGSSQGPPSRVPRSMQAAMIGGWLTANVLHDVYLATGGPSPSEGVISQHPESGPDPLPNRQLHTRLNSTVLLRKQTGCLYPGRSIVARPSIGTGNCLLFSLDDQIPLSIQIRIVTPVCIG